MTISSPCDCHEVVANISAYLDGELEVAACDVIERHCEACPRCAALVTGLRETVGLCRQAGAAQVPESVRERARANLRQLLAERDAKP